MNPLELPAPLQSIGGRAPLDTPLGTNTTVVSHPLSPSSEAVHQIAQDTRKELLRDVSDVVFKNYLPTLSMVKLVNTLNPENAIAKLTNAQSLDELIACLPELEQMLGTNQSAKSDLFSDSPGTQISVPARIIKYVIKKFISNLPMSPNRTEQQNQGLKAFATYLAKLASGESEPQKIIEELVESDEALPFLEQLPIPNPTEPENRDGDANAIVARMRQELALQIVKKEGSNLRLLPDDLSGNQEFVEKVIVSNPDALSYAVQSLQNNMAINKLHNYRTGRLTLENPSAQEDRTNPLLVLAAVNKDGCSLEFASDELKNNPDIVRAAIRQDSSSLEFASDELKNDRDFMMFAIGVHSWSLEFASDQLRNDRELVIASIQKDSQNEDSSFQFASDALRDEPGFVKTVVSIDGKALRFASDRLRDDFEIVKAAVKSNFDALEFASDRLKNILIF